MKFLVDFGIFIFNKNGPNSGAVIAPPPSESLKHELKGQGAMEIFKLLPHEMVPCATGGDGDGGGDDGDGGGDG